MKTSICSWLVACLFLFAAVSCKKDKEVNPDLAGSVAGTYQGTYMKLTDRNDPGNNYDGKLPVGGFSAKAVLNRTNETTVSMAVSFTENGKEEPGDFADYTVVKDGDAVTLSFQGKPAGVTIRDKELELTGTDNGTTLTIRATKQ